MTTIFLQRPAHEQISPYFATEESKFIIEKSLKGSAEAVDAIATSLFMAIIPRVIQERYNYSLASSLLIGAVAKSIEKIDNIREKANEALRESAKRAMQDGEFIRKIIEEKRRDAFALRGPEAPLKRSHIFEKYK